MPHCPSGPLPAKQRASRRRFADEAPEILINEFNARAIDPSSGQVKLFGGAMFAKRAGGLDVGVRNIEVTRRALHSRKENIGGTPPCRLSLDLKSGHVWMTPPTKPTTNR